MLSRTGIGDQAGSVKGTLSADDPFGNGVHDVEQESSSRLATQKPLVVLKKRKWER